ncbi:S8 family peptidase [Cellulomonas hominis]
MDDAVLWDARVLTVIGRTATPPTRRTVLESVALAYAGEFGPHDREYEGPAPRWHLAVDAALDRLTAAGALDHGRGYRLVPDVGRAALIAAEAGALARAVLAEDTDAGPAEPSRRPGIGDQPSLLVVPGIISPALREYADRAAAGELTTPDPLGPPGAVPRRPPARRAARGARAEAPRSADDVPLPLLIELNLRHERGSDGAFDRLVRLWKALVAVPREPPDAGDRGDDARTVPARLAEDYATGVLTLNQLKCLVSADAVPIDWGQRALFRVWPDFEVSSHVDVSAATIKADAAHRTFDADGAGIVWAVVDSGIDGTHPHFRQQHTLDDPSVARLHRDFTTSATGAAAASVRPVGPVGPVGPDDPVPGDDPAADEPAADQPDPLPSALVDELGHGTHVAAIIAGSLAGFGGTVVATTARYNADNPTEPLEQPRAVTDPGRLQGMAPRTRLVSLKVLAGGGTLVSRVSRVIAALAYVRAVNTRFGKQQRIQGVNLSVGYEFDASWYACGASPLCLEVDKLVRSGVVVVVAAGNSGYGTITPELDAPATFSIGMTINDPGNAERAITVGSTHRDMPHTYGVSYFSSKGPTGDGRRKPDLVAPGERITSAAAGGYAGAARLTGPDQGGGDADDVAVYVEKSGTSMAAPHVSGAVACFLSARREFIGQPERVKEIFLASATPLGRDRMFEGAGLVDLLRALQSV